MTTLTLEIPSNLYRRLYEEANRLGKSPQVVAQELLAERLATATPVAEDEGEKARQILKKAGLLTELSPNVRRRAEASTATLEEVRAALDRVSGKPLSEIVLEQRGSKEW